MCVCVCVCRAAGRSDGIKGGKDVKVTMSACTPRRHAAGGGTVPLIYKPVSCTKRQTAAVLRLAKAPVLSEWVGRP